MPQVLIVHGWSDTYESLQPLKNLLVAAGYQTTQVFLGTYASMRDDVTFDDLATGLQRRLTEPALSPPRSSRLCVAERASTPAHRAASRASDSFRRPSHSPLISQRTAIGTAAMLMPASPSPRSPMPAYTQAPIWSPAR